MVYLSHFEFPDREVEYDFTMAQKRTCYDTCYPFLVLSEHRFHMIDFEPVTILYGGNGSGKTTALNVIAEKLGVQRETLYNRSAFFEDYTGLCSCRMEIGLPPCSRIITSDDVFDFMLNIRSLNEGIDQRRGELFKEYLDARYSDFRMRSLEDYEQLRRVNLARAKTQSKYVRKNLMGNIREHSNGESAFLYGIFDVGDSGAVYGQQCVFVDPVWEEGQGGVWLR